VRPTTGIAELDLLLGGLLPGDNVVWEVDSGAPVDTFISRFLTACSLQEAPVVYVSFNRSPQTIFESYASLVGERDFILVDSFSCGKGNSDDVFLDFFSNGRGGDKATVVRLENPSDPSELQGALSRLPVGIMTSARYVFDSLTGMSELWGGEKEPQRFFSHFCPRLYDLDTIAYWILERAAHSQGFVAKIRHVTQVVLEVGVEEGTRSLTLRRAANRRSADIGVPQPFHTDNGHIVIRQEAREVRELELLTRMSEALGTALDPSSFFEEVMKVLADQLGMVRGTLVLLDRETNSLRIAAAHGLRKEEKELGEYAVGEGVTGRVVETGIAEVVPDIRKDPRFLDRTTARKADTSVQLSFICVPVKVEHEVVGALSVDRPFGVDATLEKDRRLLSIVAAIVSQVLRINRLLRVEKEEILARNETVLEGLRKRYRIGNVVGESRAIRQVLGTAGRVANSRASILITGETGTGKELIANVVHYNSGRAEGPFVKVNCGALPETLLESELFGHVKGAFTGAVRDRRGRFEVAHGGTLFLDEISETSPRLQVKLLRVLQQGEFEPVGSAKTVGVDVRVVAATNKDLRAEIRGARFREDLYYRLNVIPIHLPPLRERRGDIPPLVDHFLERFNEENGKSVTKLSRQVLDLLLEYPWPGNVRELENCVERVVVLSDGDCVTVDLLPDEIRSGVAPAGPAEESSEGGDLKRALEAYVAGGVDVAGAWRDVRRMVDRAVISGAMAGQGVSQRELARMLGISRVTLRKKLKELGLT
jgi:Nif-specific regulatory protein